MSDKPCPVTQIQAYRAYEKLLEIMEDETDDQTEVFSTAYKALYWIANGRRAQPANEPLVRCENCIHWDKSISFLLSAHACAFWSASKRNPRYTEWYEFCSFAEAKPEGSENDGQTI